MAMSSCLTPKDTNMTDFLSESVGLFSDPHDTNIIRGKMNIAKTEKTYFIGLLNLKVLKMHFAVLLINSV
jgi:hypothetical protein